MALPDKLPKPAKHPEHFTEADWEKYFEDRKKYDRPISDEEAFELIKKSNECNKKGDIEGAFFYGRQIITAVAALAQKQVFGLKSLSEYNLYEAKKVYPDEF